MPQWKDLIQGISYGSGFAGDVSEVTAGSPEKTDEPFHFAYNYTRKDYPNWSGRQISSPLPPMLTPAPDTKPSHPILLGVTGEIQYDSRVELPKGYSAELPSNVDLKQDFADYHASYSTKNGVLTTERHMVVKLREVPVSEYEAYKKFAKAVGDDHELYVALSSSSSPVDALQGAISHLPGSDNPEAARGYDDAVAAAKNNNLTGAIHSLTQAVEADPHFTRAWMLLSQLYVFTGQREFALEELRMAYDADPHQPVINKALVASLLGMQNYEEAISVLREVVKTNPDDADAFSNLGAALFALKRYAEAAEAVEAAVKVHPDRPGLYTQLGSNYLHAGDDEKSVAAFRKAVAIDPRPLWFNNIGYDLADANKQLPMALEYAGKAVREEEEASAKVNLPDLRKEDLGHASALAIYWDTLGWVYFRMGNLDQAEKYLNSSWLLAQDPEVADHLGQLYEKQSRKEAAIHIYRMALYRFSLRPNALQESDEKKESRSRLEHLSPGSADDSRTMPAISDELSRMRTFKLPRLVPKSASAEFFLLLAPGSKVEDVKFISGSKELESSAQALRAIDFKPLFPDQGPARLLRRGILACYEYSGCSLVLYNPEDVRSVN
jgi:tetratricopeptide (TPR) repeat protein